MPVAVHACAAIALALALRAATFPRSWYDVPLLDAEPAEPLPTVTAIVPARDEERSIEACVRSLAEQRFARVDVVVVDDRSTDATPAILARLAAEYGNVRVVRGADLPEGWIGKPWALDQGAAVARGEWLLFTDADSVHAPAGTASALTAARVAGADALSICTGQELGTFWERATLPFILGTIFFAGGTLADVNDPRTTNALANGQYILVRRDAYDALGGHAALRGEIVEDVEFARRLKADGRYRLAFLGGSAVARVRMYHTLAEIWEGFTKNVYVGADGDVPALLAGSAFMLALSAPPVLAVAALARGRRYEALEAALAAAAIVATIRRGIAMVGMPRSTAYLQPIGTAFFAAVTLNSTLRVLTGRGVTWRGRRYSGRPSRTRAVSRGM